MTARSCIRWIATAGIAAAIVLIGMVVGAIAFAPATSAQSAVTEGPSGQAAIVTVDSLTFRQEPGLDGAVIAWVPYGTELELLDGPVTEDGYDWYQLEQDGTIGWSVEGFSLTDPGASVAVGGSVAVPDAQTIWTVTAGFLEVRSEPSGSSGIARIVTHGTQLIQTGASVETDGRVWYPVDDTGWVGGERNGASGGLFPERYPLYVTDDGLNVRTEASLTGPVVLTLNTGDAVNVFASSTDSNGNDWFAVNEDNTLWVAADFLTISPPSEP